MNGSAQIAGNRSGELKTTSVKKCLQQMRMSTLEKLAFLRDRLDEFTEDKENEINGVLEAIDLLNELTAEKRMHLTTLHNEQIYRNLRSERLSATEKRPPPATP